MVVAIDLLGTGEPGVGVLTAAIGAGAVLGSLGASLLVGTQRLGTWFALGVVLWGLPVTLMGLVPYRLAAVGLLACVGVGNALIDLSGFTLLARLASDAVLARVFGVAESMVALSIGLGALAASLTVDWIGVRPTLVVWVCCVTAPTARTVTHRSSRTSSTEPPRRSTDLPVEVRPHDGPKACDGQRPRLRSEVRLSAAFGAAKASRAGRFDCQVERRDPLSPVGGS